MYISLASTRRPGAEPGADRRRRGIRTVSSTVVTLGIVSMLTDISSESVAAVLPLYITGLLGLTTIAFGVIDGLYQGVSALVRVGAGYTSDRIDRPKRVAFLGYALAAAARVALLFATGFAGIAAVVTADRIGKGIRTAPRESLITAASKPEHFGVAFGTHRTLDNIGAAVGPLLAFSILFLVPDGYDVVFAASLAFAVIGAAILGLLVPDLRSRRAAASASMAPTDAAARRSVDWRGVSAGPMRRVLAAAGILGLLTIGDGFVYLVLQARGGFAVQWFPLLYVGTTVAFLAFSIPFGRLADRVGRGRVFVFGHVGLLAAYVVAFLPIADLAATLLCLAFLGAFYATTDGVLAALAAQLSPDGSRATGIAAAQTVVAAARFVSAVGFGILWYAIGRETSLAIVAAMLAVGILATYVVMRPVFVLTAPRAVAADSPTEVP